MASCGKMRLALAVVTCAFAPAPRRVAVPRLRSSPEPLSLDELERMEAELLGGGRPAPLGRECELYRWTQDGAGLRVEVPLPFAPPAGDVSLVVGGDGFAVAVVNSGVEIRGELGGAADAPNCAWNLETDAAGAPALVVDVRKAGGGGAGAPFWREFLRGEAAAPTVAYRGTCHTGAAFAQTRDAVDFSLPLPAGARAADVAVDVTSDAWRVAMGGAAVGGPLWGPVRADATAWLLDDGRLHVALEKRGGGGWWPGLTKPPR